MRTWELIWGHHFTPTLLHSYITSLLHYFTPTLLHSYITSPLHYLTDSCIFWLLPSIYEAFFLSTSSHKLQMLSATSCSFVTKSCNIPKVVFSPEWVWHTFKGLLWSCSKGGCLKYGVHSSAQWKDHTPKSWRMVQVYRPGPFQLNPGSLRR